MTVTAAAILLVVLSGQSLALGGIRVYQRVVAPVASRLGIVCRFAPSCSRYGEIVIARDGLAVGGWRTIVRVARCNPWTPVGTVDEP